MSGRKNANSKNNKLNDFFKIQIINLAVYSAVFAVMCFISVSFDVNAEQMVYVSVAFIGLSSFISAFISGIRERKNGLIRGIIGALPLNIILIFTSLALSGFKADISLLFALVACLSMSAAGGVISVNIRLK